MHRFLKVGEEQLKNRIAEYTNSQNAISLSDLKSLRNEQIQLEEFLAEKGIRYFRKKGDVRAQKSLSYAIGKDRFGQILLSTKFERPEYASNKKREIFDNYYDLLFANNPELLSELSYNLIIKYRDIERAFRQAKLPSKIQRILYIEYISYKTSRTDYLAINNEIDAFCNEQSATPKSFVSSSFRELLDIKFGIDNTSTI